MGGEKLLTLPELSAWLNIKPATIRKWIFLEVIPTIRLGTGRRSLIRFRPSQIQRWIEKHERGPA